MARLDSKPTMALNFLLLLSFLLILTMAESKLLNRGGTKKDSLFRSLVPWKETLMLAFLPRTNDAIYSNLTKNLVLHLCPVNAYDVNYPLKMCINMNVNTAHLADEWTDHSILYFVSNKVTVKSLYAAHGRIGFGAISHLLECKNALCCICGKALWLVLHLFVDISGANVDNSAKGKLDLVGRSGLQSDSSSFIPALLSGLLLIVLKTLMAYSNWSGQREAFRSRSMEKMSFALVVPPRRAARLKGTLKVLPHGNGSENNHGDVAGNGSGNTCVPVEVTNALDPNLQSPVTHNSASMEGPVPFGFHDALANAQNQSTTSEFMISLVAMPPAVPDSLSQFIVPSAKTCPSPVISKEDEPRSPRMLQAQSVVDPDGIRPVVDLDCCPAYHHQIKTPTMTFPSHEPDIDSESDDGVNSSPKGLKASFIDEFPELVSDRKKWSYQYQEVEKKKANSWDLFLDALNSYCWTIYWQLRKPIYRILLLVMISGFAGWQVFKRISSWNVNGLVWVKAAFSPITFLIKARFILISGAWLADNFDCVSFLYSGPCMMAQTLSSNLTPKRLQLRPVNHFSITMPGS
ncbi:Uncharacterized protein TCM_020008 [Theobroma cacao]|uniref:Uncharacterized protein n=1 Tax=Theobroma cacao TaxID=3641 RepID=A0A061ER97_THECC|nr:Uncharacterized protein TCM_020008 [Theobroma cacao]